MDNISKNLASNIANLRKVQNLSQAQLALVAGIPRSTLTYIESGESNPTLQNMAKIASALKVSIEELISFPSEEYKHIKSKDVIVKKMSGGSVNIQKLLPDPVPGMEIDRIVLSPKARMKGTPHIKNTKEYLYCAKGMISLYINKNIYKISEGDLFRFPGDVPHAYVNESLTKKAIGFSVVAFAHKYPF